MTDHDSIVDVQEIRNLPGLATAAEVAKLLKCSKRHILNECRAGRMAFVNIAGRFLITPDSVKNYIQGRIQPCQSAIKVLTSNGLKNVSAGISIGAKVETNIRNQRVLEIAAKLSKYSVNTSSKKANPSTS